MVRRFFIAVLVVAVVVTARLLLVVVVLPHPIPMGGSSSSSSGTRRRHQHAPVEDELAYLVALSLFDGGQVLPAQDASAGDAEDVAHGVHPRRHHPVVLLPDVHVHHLAEQVRLAVLAAEKLFFLFFFTRRQSLVNHHLGSNQTEHGSIDRSRRKEARIYILKERKKEAKETLNYIICNIQEKESKQISTYIATLEMMSVP